MNYRAIVLAGALLMLQGCAVTSSEPTDQERAVAAADAVLADDSFHQQWGQTGAIDSVETARRVKKEAQEGIETVQKAFQERRRACYSTFLVNRCIDQARRQAYDRDRELRAIVIQADDVLRADRTRRLQQERKAREAQTKKPMHMRAVTPKKPRSMPVGSSARKTRDASAAVSPVGQSAKDVQEHRQKALERRAREESNLARYEAKQAAARERMAKAEAEAAKREAARRENQASFEATLKARRDAQAAYEKNGNKKESTLSKFF